jgi:NAD(P) transhydrogenase
LIDRTKLEEIARAQISDAGQGLLKMVADPEGEQLLEVTLVQNSV